jgi:nucleoside-diphosphate-sugar epimerase
MINACKDSKFIVHTASPVVMDVKNEDELIKPAVNGTLAVMEAALKNKT